MPIASVADDLLTLAPGRNRTDKQRHLAVLAGVNHLTLAKAWRSDVSTYRRIGDATLVRICLGLGLRHPEAICKLLLRADWEDRIVRALSAREKRHSLFRWTTDIGFTDSLLRWYPETELRRLPCGPLGAAWRAIADALPHLTRVAAAGEDPKGVARRLLRALEQQIAHFDRTDHVAILGPAFLAGGLALDRRVETAVVALKAPSGETQGTRPFLQSVAGAYRLTPLPEARRGPGDVRLPARALAAGPARPLALPAGTRRPELAPAPPARGALRPLCEDQLADHAPTALARLPRHSTDPATVLLVSSQPSHLAAGKDRRKKRRVAAVAGIVALVAATSGTAYLLGRQSNGRGGKVLTGEALAAETLTVESVARSPAQGEGGELAELASTAFRGEPVVTLAAGGQATPSSPESPGLAAPGVTAGTPAAAPPASGGGAAVADGVKPTAPTDPATRSAGVSNNTAPVQARSVHLVPPSAPLACTGEGTICRFGVAGVVDGLLAPGESVHLLVKPVQPPGPWYVQNLPAVAIPGGSSTVFTASDVYLGSPEHPAESGATAQLVAVLSGPGATVGGIPLQDVPPSRPLASPGDIVGGEILVSAPVLVAVQRHEAGGQIVAPIERAVVTSPAPVIGAVVGVPADRRLWFVVRPLGLDPARFYPQVLLGPLTARDHRVEGAVGLGDGSGADRGKSFLILLVAASAEASGQLATTPAGGTDALPDGLVVLASVQVTLAG